MQKRVSKRQDREGGRNGGIGGTCAINRGRGRLNWMEEYAAGVQGWRERNCCCCCCLKKIRHLLGLRGGGEEESKCRTLLVGER